MKQLWKEEWDNIPPQHERFIKTYRKQPMNVTAANVVSQAVASRGELPAFPYEFLHLFQPCIFNYLKLSFFPQLYDYFLKILCVFLRI